MDERLIGKCSNCETNIFQRYAEYCEICQKTICNVCWNKQVSCDDCFNMMISSEAYYYYIL